MFSSLAHILILSTKILWSVSLDSCLFFFLFPHMLYKTLDTWPITKRAQSFHWFAPPASSCAPKDSAIAVPFLLSPRTISLTEMALALSGWLRAALSHSQVPSTTHPYPHTFFPSLGRGVGDGSGEGSPIHKSAWHCSFVSVYLICFRKLHGNLLCSFQLRKTPTIVISNLHFEKCQWTRTWCHSFLTVKGGLGSRLSVKTWVLWEDLGSLPAKWSITWVERLSHSTPLWP